MFVARQVEVCNAVPVDLPRGRRHVVPHHRPRRPGSPVGADLHRPTGRTSPGLRVLRSVRLAVRSDGRNRDHLPDHPRDSEPLRRCLSSVRDVKVLFTGRC